MQERTIEILKNFASINQGLIFKRGKKLRTISVMKNVFASAEIPDEIPRDFAIYDLNEFLATLSLLNKPTLDYKDDHILIQSDKTRVKYFYSSPAVVVSPPDRDPSPQNIDLEFILSEGDFNQILKASAALKLKNLGISYGKLKAFNDAAAGTTSVGNQIVIDVDTDGESDTPERVLKIENLKMISGAYNVKVTAKAVTFTNVADSSLTYLVAVEAKDK